MPEAARASVETGKREGAVGPFGIAQCWTACAVKSVAPGALTRSFNLNITHPNH
jgi:hypothetical protein